MEIGFCGNSLGLIMGEMCWDGIEQRGTWHETDGGYLWILVVWTLDPVASETMLLTDTCTFLTWQQTCGFTLTERAHAALWFESRRENGVITLIHINISCF